MDVKRWAQRKSLVNMDGSPAPVKCYVTDKAWPKGHLAGRNFLDSPSSEHVVHASFCINHRETGFEAALDTSQAPWLAPWLAAAESRGGLALGMAQEVVEVR